MNFMRFIAQELREYMAKLGVRTVDELVGRTDLLQVQDARGLTPGGHGWTSPPILDNPYAGTEDVQSTSTHRMCMTSIWKRQWT